MILVLNEAGFPFSVTSRKKPQDLCFYFRINANIKPWTSRRWSPTWSFIRALRGIVIFMLTSSKNSVLISSCSPALFTAASTLPPEGAGEEWAESAGRGETLSSLFTFPVRSASSSSSLDRTTGKRKHQKTPRTAAVAQKQLDIFQRFGFDAHVFPAVF